MVAPLAVAVLMVLAAATPTLAAGAPSPARPPARPPDEYSQAVRAVQAGDYSRAVGLLTRVVEREPGHADAWNYLGFSYRSLKQYDRAYAAYQKALALDPNHLGALEYLGELYVQTGQLARAEEILGKLQALCPAGCKELDDLKRVLAARPRAR